MNIIQVLLLVGFFIYPLIAGVVHYDLGSLCLLWSPTMFFLCSTSAQLFHSHIDEAISLFSMPAFLPLDEWFFHWCYLRRKALTASAIWWWETCIYAIQTCVDNLFLYAKVNGFHLLKFGYATNGWGSLLLWGVIFYVIASLKYACHVYFDLRGVSKIYDNVWVGKRPISLSLC